tara:strand:- start:22235 stop:23062 length:828 start_codon:yes stop_codon:yes gene_type:complete
MKRSLIASLFFLGLLGAPTIYANNNADAVVAKVNGATILKSEFEKAYKENLLFVGDKIVTKDKVLNDLINRELGIQRAKKNKLDADPIVKNKMEDILYHAQISKDLEDELQKIVVADEEVKKYYDKHPEYRTAHILFRMRAEPSKPETEEALKQAMKVYETLKQSPDKFSELANKFSQTTTADTGGDIGFQPKINLAPEYFEAINGKKPGTIVPPVRTQFGYHIIKILAQKDFKSINPAFYKKIIYDLKRDALIASYFDKMRQSAKVEVNKNVLQ